MPPVGKHVLIEGQIGAATGRIVLEHTANGGRQIFYMIDEHEVTRETFIVATKFASSLADTRTAELLAQLVDRCGDPQ